MPGRTTPALALEQDYGHARFYYEQGFGPRKLYRTSIPMAMSEMHKQGESGQHWQFERVGEDVGG